MYHYIPTSSWLSPWCLHTVSPSTCLSLCPNLPPLIRTWVILDLAHPNDVIWTWSLLEKPHFQIWSYSGVLGVRISTYFFWEDTIQPVAMPIKLEAYKDHCNRPKMIFQFCFLPPCLLPPSVSIAPQPQSPVAFWAHCSLPISHACLVCSCFSLSRMPFLTLSTWKVSVLSSRPGIMSLASGCHYRPYCLPACLLLCLLFCGSQWNPLLAYWCSPPHQLLVINPRPGSGPPCSGLKDALLMNKGGNLTSSEIYGGKFP